MSKKIKGVQFRDNSLKTSSGFNTNKENRELKASGSNGFKKVDGG